MRARCVSVRACPCVYACHCERMCVRSCVSIGLRLRARVCSEGVRAPRRCARPSIAWRRRAASIARPAPRVAAARAWLGLVPSAGLARVGRRCHVDEPHRQRGMDCTVWAHDRDRRRRRHLRHRRQRHWHRLPRRLGQHRRRCAAGLVLVVGDTRWVLRGYPRGTRGTERYNRGTEEYSQG